MTGFWAVYTGRRLGHTMKFMSFPISNVWLIKVATCVGNADLRSLRNPLPNYGDGLH